ncbi:hypothetical protein [Elioraea sp.]|jgi:hypothetical protein|uniref:hypothetical protein n=1 Tax=Elioraea sp. TaxID=2185103 RepID=UPI00307E8C54
MLLMRLWRGEVPLEQAIWTWGVLVALPVNIVTTVGTFLLIAADRPFAAFFVGYVMSIPYNVLALVAIWRSAGLSDEPARVVWTVRSVAVVWLTLLSVT